MNIFLFQTILYAQITWGCNWCGVKSVGLAKKLKHNRQHLKDFIKQVACELEEMQKLVETHIEEENQLKTSFVAILKVLGETKAMLSGITESKQ